MIDRTETQRQRMDDAIRQSGELSALLGAINGTMPNPLLALAAELAARLDDAVEEIVLAG